MIKSFEQKKFIEEYIGYNNSTYTYDSYKWKDVSDCWFLNSNNMKWGLKFFRKNIYKEYRVCIFKKDSLDNLVNVVDINDENLHDSWKILLINLFDIRFSIERDFDKITIKSQAKDDIYDFGPTTMYIEKIVVDSVQNLPESNQKKCRNIDISNKKITIYQTKPLIEFSSNRLALIYILAKAYIYKLEDFLEKLVAETKQNRSLKQRLKFWQVRSKLYENVQMWNAFYLFTVPLNVNRVIELSLMWDDLVEFFKLKTLVDEVGIKIKELAAIYNDVRIDKMNINMYILTIIGTLATILSLKNLFF